MGSPPLGHSVSVRLGVKAQREAERLLREKIVAHQQWFASDPAAMATAWMDARDQIPKAERQALADDLTTFGELAAKESPPVQEARKRFVLAWSHFEHVLTETLDAPMVRDETLKLLAVKDAQWKAHSTAVINAIVARQGMLNGYTSHIATLEAKAATWARSAQFLEQALAEDAAQRKAAPPVPVATPAADSPAVQTVVRELAVLPYVPGMPSSMEYLVQQTETYDYIKELQAAAASPPAPPPQQLQLVIPEALAAKLVPTPVSGAEDQGYVAAWQELEDSFEDGGLYRWSKAARTFEQVDDFEPPDWNAASDAGKRIK